MKTYGAFIIFTLISTTALSMTVDLEEFNKKVNAEIDSVLADNPEVYEQRNSGRVPASVPPEANSAIIKLDEIEEQASGQKSW